MEIYPIILSGESNYRLCIVQADAASVDDLCRVAATVRAEKGVIDVIVSTAALVDRAAIDKLTTDHFDKTFNLSARAEEIANAALFLASDQSSYMTGADLMDDGGVDQA